MIKPLLLSQDFQITNKSQEQEIEEKEKLGIRYAIISCILFGLLSFHIKLTKIIYPDKFDANVFMFWRSFSSSILAYIIVRYKSERILTLSEINPKFWFWIRTFFNYGAFLNLTLCMVELRAATASCMSSMSPALMIIMSIIILKEKFHVRYLLGIIICFIGSAMIVLNEKKPIIVVENFDPLEEIEQEIERVEILDPNKKLPNIIQGVFYGIYHIIFSSLVNVAQKKLSSQNISIETQIFYIGAVNSLTAIIVAMFDGIHSADLSLGFFCALNGIIFYSMLYFQNKSLKSMPLTKFTPFLYIGTLTVFVCGVAFAGETLYLTDIIGSLLIVSFNVYNSYYPIKND